MPLCSNCGKLNAVELMREGLMALKDIAQGMSDTEAGTQIVDGLDRLFSVLDSASPAKSLSFSDANPMTLDTLKIVDKGFLLLKPTYPDLAQTSRITGKHPVWSSDGLYHHLELLEELVPRENETAARLWSDSFLFRASTMLSPNDRMVLAPENRIPATHIDPIVVAGVIDYTASTTKKEDAAAYHTNPWIRTARTLNTTFFIIEAKSDKSSLSSHIPQAVSEMLACAKQLEKQTIRGALTNGLTWIFLILSLNMEAGGATYRWSYSIGGKREAPEPDVISGILAHWIQNSFEEIGDDDWFFN